MTIRGELQPYLLINAGRGCSVTSGWLFDQSEARKNCREDSGNCRDLELLIFARRLRRTRCASGFSKHPDFLPQNR
jgi:hypothetical protein